MVETQIMAHLNGVLTPEVIGQIQTPTVITSLAGLIAVLVVVVLLAMFIKCICKAFTPTPSQAYRSLMSDMYVVGMVKKFADEDGIDLVKELKAFSKIDRKQRLKSQDIDAVIADDLKEKINAKADKEISKIEED